MSAAKARGTVGGGTLRSRVAIPSLSAPALGRARQEVVDLADPSPQIGRTPSSLLTVRRRFMRGLHLYGER